MQKKEKKIKRILMTQWTAFPSTNTIHLSVQITGLKISQVMSYRQSTKAGLTKAKILHFPSPLEESQLAISLNR